MSVAALETQFLQGLAGVSRLGLAVSGGGDSMAMLHLAHRAGLRPDVATVDHGLREASAAEATMVASVCAKLGLRHTTLKWQNWDGQGNLQDNARRARRALLATWAQGMDAVALGHTRDDLAETFLMRLSRAAGIDGLAAMRGDWTEGGTRFLRPMLAISREDLRSYLREIGADWVEDPSNDLDRFDRVRARKALKVLQPLGISGAGLAQVAQHMAAARAALDTATDTLAQSCLVERAGILAVNPALFSAPPEMQRRLIQRVILWLVPNNYAPRGPAISHLLSRLSAGLPAQLGGAAFLSKGDTVYAFQQNVAGAQDPVWVIKSAPQNMTLAPLGAAGLAQWKDWRETGLPRAALLTQPALWSAQHLIASPLMPQSDPNVQFLRTPSADKLFHLSLSH